NIFESKTGWQRSIRLYHAIDCKSRCHFQRRSGLSTTMQHADTWFLAGRILPLGWRSWRRPVGTSLGRNLDILRSRGPATPYTLSFSRLIAVIEERRQTDPSR